jgi:hypothetical protein
MITLIFSRIKVTKDERPYLTAIALLLDLCTLSILINPQM